MPSRSFINAGQSLRSRFKAQKDRVTLVMCGNAADLLQNQGSFISLKITGSSNPKKQNALPD